MKISLGRECLQSVAWFRSKSSANLNWISIKEKVNYCVFLTTIVKPIQKSNICEFMKMHYMSCMHICWNQIYDIYWHAIYVHIQNWKLHIQYEHLHYNNIYIYISHIFKKYKFIRVIVVEFVIYFNELHFLITYFNQSTLTQKVFLVGNLTTTCGK